jgi:hypothetical protein
MRGLRTTMLIGGLLAIVLLAVQRWQGEGEPPSDADDPIVQPVGPAVTVWTRGGPTRLSAAADTASGAAPRASGDSDAGAIAVGDDVIPGEYILRFYDEQDRRTFEAIARELGVQILDTMRVGHAVRIRVKNPGLLRELLKKSPTPTDWMPNTYVSVPERGDNAPLPPERGYQAFGSQTLAWLGISDNASWGNGITVGVLDTGIAAATSLRGINIEHVDLVGEAGGTAAHGTAVASLIAGREGAVRGIAPGVDLLSLKVMSDSGLGDTFTLAKGIIDAVDRGVNVINFSLGSRGDSAILREAVRYAVSRGVVLVAAAGNDAVRGVLYPARYDEVIAVAAVDAAGRHLYFSNRGAEIVLAAPGAGVVASHPEGDPVLFSGTSAAVPLVAGTVASLLAQNPDLSTDAIVALLTRYSNDAGAPGADETYGAGILDVGRLTQRDTAGIYDMVAMIPYIDHDAPHGLLHMDVSAQNRGTEMIREVVLLAEWSGRSERYTFYDVHVGDTISQPFTFPYATVSGAGIDFSFSVSPVGVTDVNPNNNALRSRIAVETP